MGNCDARVHLLVGEPVLAALYNNYTLSECLEQTKIVSFPKFNKHGIIYSYVPVSDLLFTTFLPKIE